MIREFLCEANCGRGSYTVYFYSLKSKGCCVTIGGFRQYTTQCVTVTGYMITFYLGT